LPGSEPACGNGELGTAFAALYEQLRRIARARLAGTDGGSLQATALVHEALLRLVGRPLDSFNSEEHLLATAARAIRQVIVDHLRARHTAKRNAGRTGSLSALSTELSAMVGGCDDERAQLALDTDAALTEIATIDPQLRSIVELHVFGGIPLSEIGALVGCSERTVHRRWAFAAALLRDKLDEWSAPKADD
jgi:RNA polymerase sigma factor (TIGR02999 family)